MLMGLAAVALAITPACDDSQQSSNSGATDVAGDDTTTSAEAGQSDSATDSGSQDVSDVATNDAARDDASTQCDRTGFNVAVPFVFSDETQVSAQAYSAAAEEFDLMELLIATDEGGSTAPGSYELGGAGIAGCVYCLSISADCVIEDDVNLICEGQEFRAISGTAMIASGGTEVGDTFTVTIGEAMLVETDGLGLEVDGGDTWCVDGVQISYTIE